MVKSGHSLFSFWFCRHLFPTKTLPPVDGFSLKPSSELSHHPVSHDTEDQSRVVVQSLSNIRSVFCTIWSLSKRYDSPCAIIVQYTVHFLYLLYHLVTCQGIKVKSYNLPCWWHLCQHLWPTRPEPHLDGHPLKPSSELSPQPESHDTVDTEDQTWVVVQSLSNIQYIFCTYCTIWSLAKG